jgi:hypothetical protein
VISRQGGSLVAVLERNGVVVRTRHLRDLSRDRLQEWTDRHRASFETDVDPDPYGLWGSSTGELLASVYELISRPLIELVDGWSRVALELIDAEVWQLPVETAHGFRSAALFEKCQLFRWNPCVVSTEPSSIQRDHLPAFPARTFHLERRITDGVGLPSVTAEGVLIDSIQAEHRRHTDERLVHIAGHDPTIPDIFEASERAHVVLSGCSSLPRALPGGVGSVTGSLWPVDDQTNAQMIATLHARMATGIPPAEALRQAQLFHRSHSPVVWAAYAHVGSPV